MLDLNFKEVKDHSWISKGSKFCKTVFEYPRITSGNFGHASHLMVLEINSFTTPSPYVLSSMASCIQQHTLKIEHIAITKEGRVITRAEVYKMVESFLKNNNIAKRGVHMLRHSFRKHLVHQNVNLSTIKAFIGHENIQTTMIYASSDEKSMISAVNCK